MCHRTFTLQKKPALGIPAPEATAGVGRKICCCSARVAARRPETLAIPTTMVQWHPFCRVCSNVSKVPRLVFELHTWTNLAAHGYRAEQRRTHSHHRQGHGTHDTTKLCICQCNVCTVRTFAFFPCRLTTAVKKRAHACPPCLHTTFLTTPPSLRPSRPPRTSRVCTFACLHPDQRACVPPARPGPGG